MISVMWDPVQPVLIGHIVEIYKRIRAAGIPIVSVVPNIEASGHLFNFDDSADTPTIQQAFQIANGYDAAADEADKKQKKAERDADLQPFTMVDTLIQQNASDRASLKAAKLADVKDLLDGLYVREALILKALSRMQEGQSISQGDGQ